MAAVTRMSRSVTGDCISRHVTTITAASTVVTRTSRSVAGDCISRHVTTITQQLYCIMITCVVSSLQENLYMILQCNPRLMLNLMQPSNCPKKRKITGSGVTVRDLPTFSSKVGEPAEQVKRPTPSSSRNLSTA